jgi:predicted MPP superfamily phosphohydrolase
MSPILDRQTNGRRGRLDDAHARERMQRTAEMDAATCAARQEWAEARQRILDGGCWVGPDGPRSRWRSRLFNAAIAVFACGMKLCGLHARGKRNALSPLLVQFELSFPALPAAFDGYRILHLTDTHLDVLPELGRVAGGMLDGTEVDLLILTGDVLADPDAAPLLATGLLAEAIAGVAVRDRPLAVLGNHDSVATAEALETLGFEVLLNRATTIERGGERVRIIGLDDVHSFYTEAARAALLEEGAGFRIALVHSPEMADHAAAAGVALYLCGHTHGGQICLPGGRAVLTMLRRCRRAAKGLWHEGDMVGYTSRGLGVSGRPLRFNCLGEMTVITLRRG